jgi:site-specific recombinase
MHLTLATKQPAMTASYIAQSIEQKGLSKSSRKELSTILAQIMRSQFISLIGNLIVVLPLCFLSAWAFVQLDWAHAFTEAEAAASLKSNHPLLSGSLLFAVFTGVFLTLAGLITGYYDNKIVFSNIPKRVLLHPVLKRVMPAKMLEKLVALITDNSGAVMGNLCLGMFLGLAGNFGKFVGIPFDIRHITISAGNFGIAISQGYGFGHLLIITVFVGVISIGIINIISSFLFSFLIACRSRYLSSKQTWLVLASMTAYIFKNPGILIFRKEQRVDS